MYESANDTTLSAYFTNGFSFDGKYADPPDCIILDNRIFENFILADEPFVKALHIFEACVSFDNNL